MTLEHWLIYLVAAFGLSLTPGPNGLLALTHGMRFGLRRSVATLLGGVVGFLLLIAVSMAGLGALLAASEQAFTIAKWLGAAYLLVATSNPKALIFFAAFLPQFMVPGVSLPLQFVILGGTFAIVEFCFELVLAGAAQRIAPWLYRHGKMVNRAAGATFIGIGGVLATANRAV